MKIQRKRYFRVREYLVDSDRLVFVFTGMGTRMWLYRVLVHKLNKLGYSVIIYDYPARLVLKAEFHTYEPLYAGIKADANERMKKLKPKHMYAFGLSMGTIIAARLTRDTQAIRHAAMILTYGDIATNMMHSPINALTRKNMKRKGLTEADLREVVKHYDSIRNVEGLKNKKIWLHLSRPDKVLDYKITIKTKQAFEKTIKDFAYTEDKRRGHFAAGAKYLLNADALDKFYKP